MAFRTTVTAAVFGGLLAIISHAGNANATDRSMMTAWELGTLDRIDGYSPQMVTDLKRFEQALGVTLGHRRMKAGHDHIEETKRAACRLSFRWINTRRAQLEAHKNHRIVYTISAPDSLQPLVASLRAVIRLAEEYRDWQKRCDALSIDDFNRFITATRALRSERSKIDGQTARRRGSVGWSTTFAVELAPLPFKVEFIEGSAKLKLVRSLGPLKFDLQTGVKRQTYRPNAGIRELVVRTPDKKWRVFHVSGMELELTIPASVITVSGSRLTITCSEACVAEIG